MSTRKIVVREIWCDGKENIGTRSSSFGCLESIRSKDFETLTELRKEASHWGWLFQNKHDYCPRHARHMKKESRMGSLSDG